MESLLTNTAIGTITSRVMDSQGQNSQKLDIKTKPTNKNPNINKVSNNIFNYIRRKTTNVAREIRKKSGLPEKNSSISVKVTDKTIETNRIYSNRYHVLLDELALLEQQTLTGFAEVESEKTLLENLDEITGHDNKIGVDHKDGTARKFTNAYRRRNRRLQGNNQGSESSDSDGGDANDREKTTNEDDHDMKDEVTHTNDDSNNKSTTNTRKVNATTSSGKSSKHKLKSLRAYTRDREEVPLAEINLFNNKMWELFPEMKGKVARLPCGMYDINDLEIQLQVEDYVVEPEKVVRFTTSATGTETSVGYNDTQTESSALEHDNELFKIPKRKSVNKMVKNKTMFSAYSKLLNYLRCKTFLKFRDASLMQQLVHQSNVWMVKEGYDLTDPLHYTVISNAVTVAFLISTEELTFRQAIKNKANWDNMTHMNKTIAGDLGKVFRLPSEGSVFSDSLDTMALNKQKTVV